MSYLSAQSSSNTDKSNQMPMAYFMILSLTGPTALIRSSPALRRAATGCACGVRTEGNIGGLIVYRYTLTLNPRRWAAPVD